MIDLKTGNEAGIASANQHGHYDKHIDNALCLLSPISGASDEYCQGVVNGLISAMMHNGNSYDHAIGIIVDKLPIDFRFNAIPAAFVDDIADELEQGSGRLKYLHDSQMLAFSLRKWHMLKASEENA